MKARWLARLDRVEVWLGSPAGSRLMAALERPMVKRLVWVCTVTPYVLMAAFWTWVMLA